MVVNITVRSHPAPPWCRCETQDQNVEFLNNPAHFLDNYQFRVTFECSALLNDGEANRTGFCCPCI